jgi:hypothetical protein
VDIIADYGECRLRLVARKQSLKRIRSATPVKDFSDGGYYVDEGCRVVKDGTTGSMDDVLDPHCPMCGQKLNRARRYKGSWANVIDELAWCTNQACPRFGVMLDANTLEPLQVP